MCFCVKPRSKIKCPPMGFRIVTERPFQRLHIDILAPYARLKKGNKVFSLVLDHATRFPLLKTMPKATFGEVSKYLEESAFSIFGVPEYIHSNDGVQLRLETFHHLSQLRQTCKDRFILTTVQRFGKGQPVLVCYNSRLQTMKLL